MGWPMTRFRVMGILVIVPGLSWGPRKQRLYIDVIGNPKLGVRGVRALSGADVRARLRPMGRE